MNKRELIDTIADTTGWPKATVAEVLDNAMDLIQQTVAAGEKVALNGFGSFDLAHHAARTARNPSTGEPVKVPESWKPKFRPAPVFVGMAAQVQKGGTQ